MKKQISGYAEYQNLFASVGFGSTGLGGGEEINTVTYFWVFSGETPTALRRGQWTADGVWGTSEVWMG